MPDQDKSRRMQNKLSKSLVPALIGGAAGVTVSAGVLGATGVAAYLARQLVVPPKRPVENLKILALGYDTLEPTPEQNPRSIRLPITDTTRAPGTYGFYFDDSKSFALIGKVLSFSPSDESVTREVSAGVSGDLNSASRGRISGVVAPTPAHAGYRASEISLDLAVGSAPAWLIHPGAHQKAKTEQASSTWAIMVHGRGATRAETLRALESTQALGMTSLHISYRNDREAPASDDGRYGLGFTEWEDVDTAIEYALQHGAQDVVLFGWSMGGSISLQAMDQAKNKKAIKALVLDGPAVDWLHLIQYHSQLNRIPLFLGELGVSMISKPLLTIFTGLKKPIDLARLSWTRRPQDIRVPTLIVHSLDDAFVPAASSQELAEKSNLVDFVAFKHASHTREWNVDSAAWRKSVTSWLAEKLSISEADQQKVKKV